MQRRVLAGWLRQVSHNWLFLSGWKKSFIVGAFCLLTLVAVLSFFLWTGVAAALQAREHFHDVEAKLRRLSPVGMLDAGLYQFLATQFRDAEQSAGRARSRLRFLGLFTWLPGSSGRVKESLTQLEMAYFIARGGHSLATAYERALAPPLEELDGDVAAQRITEALQRAQPLLMQAEGALAQVRRLLKELSQDGLDPRYAALIDTYLPQIQAVVYISRASPETIGRAYVLSRELITVGDLAADPLKILSDPAGVMQSLATIVGHAHRLAEILEQVERTLATNTTGPASDQQELLPVIQLMKQGVNLLKNVTEVAQRLLGLAAVVEKDGFLTQNFGAEAGPALKEAEAKLALALEDTASFKALLFRQGKGAKTRLGSIDPLEAVLGQALAGTRFLRYFLGFQGPRAYLILGQDQQDIRATGGFIGIVVRMTLDQGELTSLVFQESVTVDPLPPKYPNNPLPPEPVYWYLWMGRLLFRDINWSPHFPNTAAQAADLYLKGQGIPVDGVLATSQRLMEDLVEVLGNIRVPSLAKPLTRETTTIYSQGVYSKDILPYRCGPHNMSPDPRRCFQEDVIVALHRRLTTQLASEDRVSLFKVIKTALNRRDLFVHILDPEEGALLGKLGWNGAIPPVDHDYLRLVDVAVDSSILGRDVPGSVERNLDYQVSLRMREPADSRLRIRYNYQGVRQDRVCRQSEPLVYYCYWNYFRIYLPQTAINVTLPPVPLHQGAEKLIWGYSDPDSASLVRDADVGPARLTEVGGYIVVEPNSVMTIPLEYQLPWKIVRPLEGGAFEYRLLVQKQPGIDRDQVSVSVELPPGAELLAASPTPTSRNGRSVVFNFPLDSDKELSLVFRASSGG